MKTTITIPAYRPEDVMEIGPKLLEKGYEDRDHTDFIANMISWAESGMTMRAKQEKFFHDLARKHKLHLKPVKAASAPAQDEDDMVSVFIDLIETSNALQRQRIHLLGELLKELKRPD